MAMLIRGNARWIGMVAAISIIVWPRITPPDIWVDPEGANAAIRSRTYAYVLRTKVKQYGYEQWLRHYGLNDDRDGLGNDYICKGLMCTPQSTAKYKVGFWFGNKAPKPTALANLCQHSELIILRTQIETWPEACTKTNRIQREDISQMGAMELTRNNNGWQIKAAEPVRGLRPWVR